MKTIESQDINIFFLSQRYKLYMAYATKQWIFFWSVSLGLTGMEEGAVTLHDMLYRKVDQQGR